MSFEIRSDLPMRKNRGRARREYPFADLKVGQCIVVPVSQRATLASRAKELMKANPGWQLLGGEVEPDKHGFWCKARPDAAPAKEPQPTVETARKVNASPLPPIKHRSAAMDQRARAGK